MSRIQLGIAGSGFGRNVLWPVFSKIDHVRVVALTGLRGGGVVSGSSPLFFGDWCSMLHGVPLDAVALALPPRVQEEAALTAAEMGVHIFCEKPLALNPSVARKILDASTRKSIVGTVDFEFRKIPVFKLLFASLCKIGRIKSVEIEWILNSQNKRVVPGSWKYDWLQGGGAMSSFGCHLADLCSAMLGRLEVESYRVYTHVSERRAEDGTLVVITAEDEFVLCLRNREEVPVTIHVDTACRSETGLHMRFIGDAGSLLLDDRNPSNYFGGFDLRFRAEDSHEEILDSFETNDQPNGRYDAVLDVALEFVSAIRCGTSTECGLAIGVENCRLIADARSPIDRDKGR